jgi:hypothetical protein
LGLPLVTTAGLNDKKGTFFQADEFATIDIDYKDII